MASIWRLSDPAAFDRLRTTGRRARSGPVSVAWAPPAADGAPPRVAFAIGKRVGGAVVRNRLRRRLRATLAALDPGPGDYLVSAGPGAAALSSSDLKVLVQTALQSLPPAPVLSR